MYTVYRHVCPNNKIYIGVTQQDPPDKRWLNGNGYAKNPLFFNAIKKFGWENIKHDILLTGLTLEEANKKERELICLCHSNQRQFGYNIANGGNFRGKHSTETRQKISIKGIGRKQSPETIAKRITRGEQHYLYGKHLSPETIEKSRIAHTGHIVTDETRQKISQTMKNKPHTHSHIQNAAKSHWVSIVQKTMDGAFIAQWSSIKSAAQSLGKNHSHIVRCCQGLRNSAYGYKWEYINKGATT